MKVPSKILLAAVAATLFCGFEHKAGFAYPINVVPATSDKEASITAKLETSNLGMLKVPRGTVKLKGEKITVGAVPDWLFDRHVVLKGEVLKSRIEGSGTSSRIRGLAYFMSGDWLNNLDNIRQKDNLTLESGVVYVGKLRGINKDTVDFQLASGPVKRIKKERISKLVSPRCYFFVIPANNLKVESSSGTMTGDADSVVFNPTVTRKKKRWFAKFRKAVPKEPKSFLAGTEGGITKAQISGLVFLDAVNTIAPLVITPIVASPLGSRAADRQLAEFDFFEATLAESGVVIIP